MSLAVRHLRVDARSPGMKAIASSGSRALAGLLALVLSLVTGRHFGASAIGLLFATLALAMIVGTVSTLGLPEVALRHLALLASAGRRLRQSLLLSVRVILAAVAGTLLLLGVLGTSLTGLDIPMSGLLAAPAVSVMLLNERVLVGLGYPVLAELSGRVLAQGFLILGVVAAHATHLDATVLPVIVPAAYWATVTISTLVIRFAIGSPAAASGPEDPLTDGHHDAADHSPSQLVREGLPLMLVASIGMLPQWLDVLMLDQLRGPESAGVYAVATRAAALIGLVLVGARAVAAPRFAQLHAANRARDLQQLAAIVNTWTILAALCLFVPLNFSGDLFGWLFGSSFDEAGRVLLVASLAQVLSVSFGLVIVLLVMSGNGRLVLISSSAALVVNVCANLALIPQHGALGAAYASVLSVFISNAVAATFVWRRLGVRPLRIAFFARANHHRETADAS